MRKIVILALCAACANNPKPESASEKETLHSEVNAAISALKKKDPSISKFFDSAHAYVVFPKVGKGGLIIGAAAGDGEVYEKGKMIGWAGMSQASIGAQIGGKTFAQIVFFEKKEKFDQFTSGRLEFGAGVDAVAADSGAGLNTAYRNGVAVFVNVQGGLMADASASGQKFTFVRK
ncbi:MAG: lipid-binding SYLF domain-containing protein [Planctomycetota bacterium]|jgi:lipid-binding SYLF domain-containing protein